MSAVAEQTIWNDLLAEGASSVQAAGIMGNMQNESGFDPEAIGDQGTSFGLVQQHGNFSFLVTGNTTADLTKQLQNIKGDIGLASGSSAGAAASGFAANFEKCVGCQVGGAQNLQRSSNAQAIFNMAQSGNWQQAATGAAAGSGGTQSATLTSFNPLNLIPGFSEIAGSLNPIKWIEDALGIPNFKDIIMRLGLILLGGIVIIVGIIVLTKSSGNSNSDAGEALQQLVANEKSSKATGVSTATGESAATAGEVASAAPIAAAA
jgi:Phage tail lysozyme